MSRPEDLLEQKMRALRRPKPVRPTNRPMMTQDLLNYVVNKNNPPYRPTGDWAQTFNEQADAGDLIRKGISAAKEAFIGSPEKLLTGEREQLDTPFGNITYPSGAIDAAAMLPFGRDVLTFGKDVISGMRVAGEPFFLKTAEALAKKMPARATPDQVISIMKGAGKLEELEWSGLLDMMRGKKLVTKDEVMNHLNTKTPKLMERMITEHSRPVPVDLQLGEDGIHRTADGGYFVKPGTANPDIFEVFTTIPHLIGDPQYVGVANNLDEAKNMIGRRMPQAKPQYTDYTMPGGENHREFVVQTPRKAGVGRDYNVPRGHSYGDPDIDRNRIFHTRMNDRIGENGEKILHIEEGQSDWAQAGYDVGFGESASLPKGFEIKPHESGEPNMWQLHNIYGPIGSVSAESPEQALELFSHNFKALKQVPDMPFKDNWSELSMKRMIQEAVEGGYDRLTWTTADQQKDRWLDALKERVDNVSYDPASGQFLAFKNGRKVYESKAQPHDLSGLIGKSGADKLTAEGYKAGTMVPINADIIDKRFFKNLYDRKWPNTANKFAKEYGVKVEPYDIPYEGTGYINSNGHPVDEYELDRMVGDEQDRHIESQRESEQDYIDNMSEDDLIEHLGLTDEDLQEAGQYSDKTRAELRTELLNHYMANPSDVPEALQHLKNNKWQFQQGEFDTATDPMDAIRKAIMGDPQHQVYERRNGLPRNDTAELLIKHHPDYVDASPEDFNEVGLYAGYNKNDLRHMAYDNMEHNEYESLPRDEAISNLIHRGDLEEGEGTVTVHSIPITDQMRKDFASGKGQSLFNVIPPIPIRPRGYQPPQQQNERLSY